MLQRGLIVSYRTPAESSLSDSHAMRAMLQEAVVVGSIGIDVDRAEDALAIKGVVEVSAIGIYVYTVSGYEVYITPETCRARIVAQADSDIIAFDATLSPHPEGTAENLIRRIKAEFELAVFADVSTLEEWVATASAGADYLVTTFSGYTVDTSAMTVRIP